MKKIPTLFQRNYDTNHLVRDEVTPGCEWVLEGEGTATRKWDGTCCMIRDGKLYKRRELRRGRNRPPDFIPSQELDPVTGRQSGWVPVGVGPEDKWHRRAFEGMEGVKQDGTYELVGPKVQGNPHTLYAHILVPHGVAKLFYVSRSFEGIRDYLDARDIIEGIVWWRDIDDPDCDKVKIKRRDFGLLWPTREQA